MKKYILLIAMMLVGIAAEAQLVRSSTLTVVREELPPVQPGYKNIVDLHAGLFDFDFGGGIHYIGGYRFNEKFLAGVGIGFEYYLAGFYQDWVCDKYSANLKTSVYGGHKEAAMPLYLHGRYYFSTREWSPYIGLSTGVYIAKDSEIEVCSYNRDMYGNWYGDPKTAYFRLKNGGVFADINIGLNHRFSATSDIAFYFGAKVWGMPSYEGEVDCNSTYDDITEGRLITCAFYLGANIAF